MRKKKQEQRVKKDRTKNEWDKKIETSKNAKNSEHAYLQNTQMDYCNFQYLSHVDAIKVLSLV